MQKTHRRVGELVGQSNPLRVGQLLTLLRCLA
jgi:hypothetical protein